MYKRQEHAAKFAELLGEVVTPSTKKNLEMRAMAENGACDGKKKLAARAKELGYDAVPVSYTHLDVYKRQVLYSFSIA